MFENHPEQLGADMVVLRPVRIEPFERARVAIGLKARLDRRAEGEMRFPVYTKCCAFAAPAVNETQQSE